MQDSEGDFRKLFEDFQPKIYRYLTRIVGEDEADDLTQEVFVRVSKALMDFRGEAKLSTWIYRIATNVAIDRLRSPSYRLNVRQGDLELTVDRELEGVVERDVWTGERVPTVEQALVRKQMNECIRSFIEGLPEHYRLVLVLADLEGLRNKEIAEILDISLNTVKIRLHRARQKLRAELTTRCDSYWLEENDFVPDLKSALEEFKDSNTI